MGYNFWRPESDPLHWVSLVIIPLALITLLEPGPGGKRSLTAALASVGFRRGNLTTGLRWAIPLGLLISAVAALASRRSSEVWDVLTSARALYMLPAAFLLLLLTAAFTEEVFFRGVLQTRLTDWTRSRVVGVLITALLFGIYHIPYAFLKSSWPSHGDLGAATTVALWEGGLGGLILGTVFVVAKRNLVVPILVHALIDLFPALALIRFGG
jgi:membrane protease YdiL (CAAX protease family)